MKRYFYAMMFFSQIFVYAETGNGRVMSEIFTALDGIKEVLADKGTHPDQLRKKAYLKDQLQKDKLVSSNPKLAMFTRNTSQKYKEPFRVGLAFEVSVGSIDQSFSMQADGSPPDRSTDTSAQRVINAETAAIFKVTDHYRLSLQKTPDENLRPYFTGRLIASGSLGGKFKGAVYMGLETSPEDASYIYLNNDDGLSDESATFVSSEIKQTDFSIFSPGVFLLYDGVGVVAEYDMRTYDIPESADNSTVRQSCDDKQLLMGIRAERQMSSGVTDLYATFQYTRKFFSGVHKNRSVDTLQDVIQKNLDFWDNKADSRAGGSYFELEGVYPHIHKLTVGVSASIS